MFARYHVDDVTCVDDHLTLHTLKRRSARDGATKRVCILAECTRATARNIQAYATYHADVVDAMLEDPTWRGGGPPLQFVYDLRGASADDWMSVMTPLLDVHTRYKPRYADVLRGTAILVNSSTLALLLNALFATVYTPSGPVRMMTSPDELNDWKQL